MRSMNLTPDKKQNNLNNVQSAANSPNPQNNLQQRLTELETKLKQSEKYIFRKYAINMQNEVLKNSILQHSELKTFKKNDQEYFLDYLSVLQEINSLLKAQYIELSKQTNQQIKNLKECLDEQSVTISQMDHIVQQSKAKLIVLGGHNEDLKEAIRSHKNQVQQLNEQNARYKAQNQGYKKQNLQLNLKNKNLTADNKVLLRNLDAIEGKQKTSSKQETMGREKRAIRELYHQACKEQRKQERDKMAVAQNELSNKILLDKAIEVSRDNQMQMQNIIGKLSQEVKVLEKEKVMLQRELDLLKQHKKLESEIERAGKEVQARQERVIKELQLKIIQLEKHRNLREGNSYQSPRNHFRQGAGSIYFKQKADMI